MATRRSQRFGWYVYDWANSAFSTTVVTAFLGPYLTSVARASAGADGYVHPFGVLPVIGALADRSHRKRFLLGATAGGGALATTMLFFVTADAGNYLLGALLFITANLFFGSSIVIYNSFLPDVATVEERDAVSSRGWALGYLGGGLLLLINMLMYASASESGQNVGLTVRTILASAGIWWALFTLVPLRLLPSAPPRTAEPMRMRAAFRQLWDTLRHARTYPQTFLFLMAYLTYNDAVQTVITMSSQFGQEELGLGLDVLMSAILLVQFVAIGGSLLFERIARWTSTKRAIEIAIVGWITILVMAYVAVQGSTGFYIMAAAIAIVLGGIQALSRSLFSQIIPLGREAEYFSLYEISDKGTSWIGPMVFGWTLTLTGSYRLAVLSLIIFLVIGFVLLTRVNVERARLEAGALDRST
jgi:UMF1 family MFS transporter